MNQFEFTKNLKTFLISLMGLGVLCLVVTYFGDDELHTRFWSNVLHNSVFFTGISFIALFFIAVSITAYTGWHVTFKRLWEAYSSFLVTGLILMLIIAGGLFLGYHNVYHWADADSVAGDKLLKFKSSFLNPINYLLFTVIIMGVWILFRNKLRNLSVSEDIEGDTSYSQYKKSKVWAAGFLPIAAFSSAAIIWFWVMSVDAHWYSTLFAWYTAASWFVSMLCLTVLMLIYLKSKGYFELVTAEHLHDVGKYLFAFSIFWTYLWFSQYMLIWYGNVGEETQYFHLRQNEYPALFYGNLLINFILPFLVLLRNDTKRKIGTMVFIASAVFFGHWLDFFLMIKPGALHTAHELIGGHGVVDHAHEAVDHAHGGSEAVSHMVSGFTMPGLLEIGTLLGFAGLFLFITFTALSKASLVPKNDPFLAESIHHHV